MANKLDIDMIEAERILDMTSNNSSSHSAWLTFMYPRLYLAKQLLSEYDLCIRGALVDQNKLIKEKDKVKDSTALQEATMLIEQYTIYESSLVDYVESLIRLNEAQAQFYNQLNESTDIQQMEALVTNINTAIDEANIASETHHDALIAFNELYSNYYETYIQ